MKTLFNLAFCTLLSSSAALCQSAITIEATDVPIPSGAFNLLQLNNLPPNPSKGNNQTWDLGSFSGTPTTTVNYIAETDPFFTNVGVDVYRDASKNLTGSVVYDIAYELDFNSNNVSQKGLYVYPQAYTLSNFTGSSADSIVFPVQGYILPTSRTIMQFPYTANSAWKSSSRHAVDFNLTVTSSGLNKTPGKHVFYLHEQDTVVGWGKMTVYTASGNSLPSDVLMLQSSFYAIDSFYLAGSPAPAPLMTAFGISQGQKTGANYAYNFYRKGSYGYFMRANFGTDNTFSTMSSAFIATDNVFATDIDDEKPLYATMLFPNPANTAQLNIKVIGKEVELSHFTITDIVGRIVQEGTTQPFSNGITQLTLSDNLPNATYFIQVTDSENHAVVREKFEILR